MARKVFYSFHYDQDVWRVSKVRNIRALEGQQELQPNRWEEVKSQGDKAVHRWIDEQMKDKSCVIVLIGTETAQRKFVKYEITRAWELGKAVMGIHIHNLADAAQRPSRKGANPFSGYTVGERQWDSMVPVHDPGGYNSSAVYANIAANIDGWVEDAIRERSRWK